MSDPVREALALLVACDEIVKRGEGKTVRGGRWSAAWAAARAALAQDAGAVLRDPTQDDRIATQRAEFDALHALAKRYNALPAIVDDDYPEARHYYESAVKVFLDACKANGRRM